MLDRDLLKRNIEKRLERDLALCNVGSVSLIVKEKGETVYENNFGEFKNSEGKVVESNAVFRLASMTKPVTAVAVMIMVDRGLIDLDKEVSFYIPEYKNLTVGNYSEDGTEILSTTPVIKEPIVRQLLSHTSGIGSDGAALYYSPARVPKEAIDTLKGAVEYYAKLPLAFEPGTKQSYSPNAAFDVAAYIVEKVSGMDYAEFLKQEIFIPCGMADTTFAPTKEQWERTVYMHDKRIMENGAENAVDATTEGCVFEYYPVTHYASGAGLASTLSDYSKFAEMLLNYGTAENGARILSEESVREMTSLQIHDEKVQSGDERWALGGRVIVSDNYKRLPKGTYGWSGAYGTHFWVDYENKITAVYMKNSRYDGGAGAVTANNFEIDVTSSIK